MRPLLKWAGGKRQLLPAIRRHYPACFTRYFEPFLGSGAVFFDLLGTGALKGRTARLVDCNADLIGCYTQLRDNPSAVVAALRKLDAGHRRGGSAFYYEVRDGSFNPAREAGAAYTPELAAMVVYLNRTGFNGLFRLNRRGGFNVPAGRYQDPVICDEVHLRRVATALASPGVTLELSSFEAAFADVGAGDFIYCDPPYAPLSRTASFAHYTAGGFSSADQARLQAHVVGAARNGAAILLSNSSAAEIEQLYSRADAREAGLVVHRVPARRAINSRSEARGPVDELLVTNVAPHKLDVPIHMAPARLPVTARKRA